MVAGTWFNQDGMYLQYGTQKAVPEVGGDYMVYGDVREIEQYIPLVPMQFTLAGLQVPAPVTSFSGTTTAAAAGIISLTTMFPLAQTAPVTAAASSVITVNQPQIFIEQVEVDTMMGVTGTGTANISVGLVASETAAQAGGANGQFIQVTSTSLSSTGSQILNAFPLLSSGAATVQGTVGAKTVYCGPTEGFTFNTTSGGVAATTGGGGWVGNFCPLPSNAITPLPEAAWISTTIGGASPVFTSGLLKVRIKYVMFGTINQ